ncbi:MAG: CocE/NonD family hydrolase [Thermoplasmatota archaeon]
MRRLVALCLLAVTLAGCATESEPEPAPTVYDDHPELVSAVEPETFSVFPGNYSFNNPLGGSVTLEPGLHPVFDVQSVVLTSELDGVDIDLSYWLPDMCLEGGHCIERTPVPVIIQASPYFPVTNAPAGSQNFGQWMHDVFVPHGYAYVQLAIRSTAGSGGCDDFRGPNMNADMSQAIDWIVAQEWSTERVALIGKSYPGSTPWYAAGTGNPHVKTIVPVSGSTNAWEVYNRNGTPESRAAIIVPNYGATAATNTDRSPEHKIENFACAEVYQSWANGVSSGATGERVTDEFWDARNSKPSVEANYEGSILLVHGLQDWNVDPAVAIPWTQELADSGLKVKQLLGQWAHDHPDQGAEPFKRYDWAEILLRWFDQELKGLDVDTGPTVQVQSTDGRWRDELAWPPKDATMVEAFPRVGTLDAAAPDTASTLAMQGATGSHAFVSWVLEAPLHIAGLPEVHFTVTPQGPGGYMGAILYDEAPDGSRERIGWTGMNFRYHAGGEEPQVVVPGEPITLRAQIQPMDAIVPAGHRIVLEVGAVTPSDRIMPPVNLPYDIHLSAESVLRLPVIERDAVAFFEPPMP